MHGDSCGQTPWRNFLQQCFCRAPTSQHWAIRGHGGDLLAGEDSIAAKTCSGLESLRGGAQRGRRVLQRGLSGVPSNGHL